MTDRFYGGGRAYLKATITKDLDLEEIRRYGKDRIEIFPDIAAPGRFLPGAGVRCGNVHP